MDAHYPPILVDATADDILAVLRDMHRQQCTHDSEADPNVSLSHDSTIAEWRDACDLLPWAKVAKWMNACWSVTIPMSDWREVLEPPKSRRLGGVCKLLAQQARLPRVRPADIFGSSCALGGTFLTIRSYLADAGADVSGLTPSTPLDECARQFAGVFLGPVSQLAPGTLPLMKAHTPVYDAFIYGILFAGIAMTVGHYAGAHVVEALACLVLGACYAGIWTVGRRVLPTSIKFGNLHTFRDLSKAIAGGART